MIEFLQDYSTEALPPETFKKGEQVSRSEESERYFVGRGLAGYVVDGKLVDLDHQPIVPAVASVEIVQPGNRRLDLGGRGGEVMTGQPPRASSGPGVPFVEAVTGSTGSPPVVLEAEVERLKAALATSDELFRDMSTSHEAEKDQLRADVERLTKEREEADAARELLAKDHADLHDQLDKLASDQDRLEQGAQADGARIAELEQQLEAASKPIPTEKPAGKSSANK